MPDPTEIRLDALVEKARREVAGRLKIVLEPEDPALISAFIAEIVTREVIALERENNADNNLMSFGDVRNVLMEVRDDAVEINKQLLGIVLMRLDEEIRDTTGQIVDEAVFMKAERLQKIAQTICILFGITVGMLISKLVL